MGPRLSRREQDHPGHLHHEPGDEARGDPLTEDPHPGERRQGGLDGAERGDAGRTEPDDGRALGEVGAVGADQRQQRQRAERPRWVGRDPGGGQEHQRGGGRGQGERPRRAARPPQPRAPHVEQRVGHRGQRGREQRRPGDLAGPRRPGGHPDPADADQRSGQAAEGRRLAEHQPGERNDEGRRRLGDGRSQRDSRRAESPLVRGGEPGQQHAPEHHGPAPLVPPESRCARQAGVQEEHRCGERCAPERDLQRPEAVGGGHGAQQPERGGEHRGEEREQGAHGAAQRWRRRVRICSTSSTSAKRSASEASATSFTTAASTGGRPRTPGRVRVAVASAATMTS